MSKGQVFVISGPSGVGKDTVVQSVLQAMPEAFLSISLTTRPPRGTERHGVEYYFTTEEAFLAEVEAGRMLEFCRYGSVLYGTPLPPMQKALGEGRPVLLVIERDGMERVRAVMPDAVTVFIAPPSFEVLKKRLIGRGTETEEQVAFRLEKAKTEIEKSGDYQYTVVNDALETCVDDLITIIKNHIQ